MQIRNFLNVNLDPHSYTDGFPFYHYMYVGNYTSLGGQISGAKVMPSNRHYIGEGQGFCECNNYLPREIIRLARDS